MTTPPGDGSLRFDASANSFSETSFSVPARLTGALPGAARAVQSPRYTDQAYFWSQSWQQAERLAHYDRLAGAGYAPVDVDDLVRWLQSDD